MPLPLAVLVVPQSWGWLRRTVGLPLPASAKNLLKDIGSRAKSALMRDRYMLICIARVKGVGDRIPELGKLRSSNRGTLEDSGVKRDAPGVSTTSSNSGSSRRNNEWEKGPRTKQENLSVATAEAKTRHPLNPRSTYPGQAGRGISGAPAGGAAEARSCQLSHLRDLAPGLKKESPTPAREPPCPARSGRSKGKAAGGARTSSFPSAPRPLNIWSPQI